MTTTQPYFIESARRVIAIEKQAIAHLSSQINQTFEQACQLLLQCCKSDGRIIVSGMGKSGHIGRKIAATLASTGSPSFFVHASEASHGDLGMITANDVVILISNSGETNEVLNIVSVIKRIGAKVIGITGVAHSSLAKHSDVHLSIQVEQEACPLNLAPTASTTTTLVLGDAIAVALLEARNFTELDFAQYHPGGSLGRRLLLTVEEVMHTGQNIPIVTERHCVKTALFEMSAKGLGMTAVVNDRGILTGIFTDGDLRRFLSNKNHLLNESITQVMTKNCTTAHKGMLAQEVLNVMEQQHINGLNCRRRANTPYRCAKYANIIKRRSVITCYFLSYIKIFQQSVNNEQPKSNYLFVISMVFFQMDVSISVIKEKNSKPFTPVMALALKLC